MSREIWLDFSSMTSNDGELQLSGLCYWALQFHQQDENYGLLLPAKKISPNSGENHRREVLQALALFQVNE
ncbi:MAG: hypothetical protein ACI9Y1_002829 [Lentisphaeria bacterium]